MEGRYPAYTVEMSRMEQVSYLLGKAECKWKRKQPKNQDTIVEPVWLAEWNCNSSFFSYETLIRSSESPNNVFLHGTLETHWTLDSLKWKYYKAKKVHS